MTRYGGAGDPARTIRLLWAGVGSRPPDTPGPKATLDLPAILDAGISLSDAAGSPTVSLRAVARVLDCTPMALYTHVRDKEELLDLMYDRVHRSVSAPADGPWPDRVRRWSDQLLDLYVQHHWITEISWTRPVLGPGEQQVLEYLLDCLQPAPIRMHDVPVVVSALFTQTRGAAAVITQARAAQDSTGDSDAAWWNSRMIALQEFAPDFTERFPLATALQEALAGRPDDRGPTVDPAVPILETAARRTLHRAIELILQGAVELPHP